MATARHISALTVLPAHLSGGLELSFKTCWGGLEPLSNSLKGLKVFDDGDK